MSEKPELIRKEAKLCRDCHGTGEVTVFRNVYGEFDFLDGVPTGEFMTCQLCNGEGYEE
jgi:DnaJ-class molecular chaperone